MSDDFSENGIFLSPNIDKFKNNPILNIKFNIKSGTQNDRKLVQSFYSRTIGRTGSDGKILTLKETVDRLMNLIDLVSKFSNSSNETNATLSAGDREDNIQIDIDFKQRQNYYIFPLYCMYTNPNYMFVGYNFSVFPEKGLFSLLKASQLRLGYGDKKSISFHQFFKTKGEFEPEFFEEMSQRYLGPGIKETKRETGMIFRYWLNRPSIYFPFHSFADAKSCYYLQFGYKRRKNDVDESKVDRRVMDIISNQEKLIGFKLGYSSSHFEDSSFENGLTTELSAEFNRDLLGSKFGHLKAHFRKFFSVNKFCVQAHAKFDKIILPSEGNNLMINDRILIRNFKGIKDEGAKNYARNEIEELNANEQEVLDTIGHLSLLELGIKIASSNIPVFKKYQISEDNWTFRPFVFANIAILPDEMKPEHDFKVHLRENTISSTGLGVQLIHPLACFELYYAAKVHRNKFETGAELQFNFGLD